MLNCTFTGKFNPQDDKTMVIFLNSQFKPSFSLTYLKGLPIKQHIEIPNFTTKKRTIDDIPKMISLCLCTYNSKLQVYTARCSCDDDKYITVDYTDVSGNKQSGMKCLRKEQSREETFFIFYKNKMAILRSSIKYIFNICGTKIFHIDIEKHNDYTVCDLETEEFWISIMEPRQSNVILFTNPFSEKCLPKPINMRVFNRSLFKLPISSESSFLRVYPKNSILAVEDSESPNICNIYIFNEFVSCIGVYTIDAHVISKNDAINDITLIRRLFSLNAYNEFSEWLYRNGTEVRDLLCISVFEHVYLERNPDTETLTIYDKTDDSILFLIDKGLVETMFHVKIHLDHDGVVFMAYNVCENTNNDIFVAINHRAVSADATHYNILFIFDKFGKYKKSMFLNNEFCFQEELLWEISEEGEGPILAKLEY